MLVAMHHQRLRFRGSRVARRAARLRVLSLALALGVAWTVTTVVQDARATEQSFGRTAPVAVAVVAIEQGQVVGPEAVELRAVPARFVPRGAVAEIPTGRRARAPIAEGEMLVAARLAEPGAGATAAGLDPGTQAVTVPRGDSAAPVRVGDVVDVIAVRVASSGGASAESAEFYGVSTDAVSTEAVARSAVVRWVDDAAVTLQVRDDQVTATVAAAATMPLSLVILQ
ncbi:hypothetical protein BH10ACT3_BH10ACT3_05970 [soil metagenome]